MIQNEPTIDLLLVDDEAEFRRSTRTTLERRGFTVREAASGPEALGEIRQQRPQIVILDLKMPGMSGIETLQEIRLLDATLPVVVLTGHGTFEDAYTGIKLEIADFVQKPIEIDVLAARVRGLLQRGTQMPRLRERTITELMVSPAVYPRLYADQSADEAFAVLTDLFFRPQEASVSTQGIWSAIVLDRQEQFVGLVRFNDLLRLVLPQFLAESPYSTFFTGMFLAQTKVVGKRSFASIIDDQVSIDVNAPLMEAVYLMAHHRLPSLPVMDGTQLVGVLRDRAVVLEISKAVSGSV